MKMKKFLAAFLSAAMVVTSAAVPVLADEPTTWNEAVTEQPEGYVEDTEAQTIEISSAEGLAWLSHLSNEDERDFKDYTVTLTKNIDISAHEWSPIGEMPEYGFTGVFDGGKHTISGLTINSTKRNQGLFSFNTGTIKNLTVNGSVTINSLNANTAGGIVVQNEGTIENCHNEAAITGYMRRSGSSMFGGNNIGGIAGKNLRGGTIVKCSNSGTIKGAYNVGGIVGDSSKSIIQDCSNTGDIICFYDESLNGSFTTSATLGTSFGGIAGNAAGGQITGCYNTGNVINDVLLKTWTGGESGNYYTGGIAGSTNQVAIENCYNGGQVRACGSSIGGLIGDSDSCTIKDSYNDGKVEGLNEDSAVGGIAGSIGGVSGSSLNDAFGHAYYSADSAEKGIGQMNGSAFDKETENDNEVNSFSNYEDLAKNLGDNWDYNPETNKPETKSNPVDKVAKSASIEIMCEDEWNATPSPSPSPEAALVELAEEGTVGINPPTPHDTAEADGEAQELYIVVNMADQSERFLDFSTVEFELFNQSDATVNVTVEPGEGMALEHSIENENIYTIYVLPGEDAEDGVIQIGDRMIIGKITISGYGKGLVQVRNAYVNRQVDDSIVKQIEVEEFGGDITVEPEDDSTIVNYERKYKNNVAAADLTINVMFPNTVLKQSADYTDMTISLHSALDTLHPIKDIELGSELKQELDPKSEKDAYNTDPVTGYVQYSVKRQVLTDTRYTITFKGKGYRTYSVDVVIPKDAKDPSVTVWNNVMDVDTHTVVTYDGENPEKMEAKTFLAGDIVEDHNINLYDLSAVVAYFGTAGIDTTKASDYVKYDLNRDGQIDSKDIAMVLVSWKN